MEPYRVPLQVYRYKPTGRRTVGRPRKRWKEQFYKNPGGGTDQLVQALKLLMTMMMIYFSGKEPKFGKEAAATLILNYKMPPLPSRGIET
jgi:hypothetical protein